MARYQSLGIARLRTDQSGAIALDSADGLQPRPYRTQHARYWYDP
jgi:competence protein ComEC